VENQRNVSLAIALSALVLIGWTYLAESWFPQPQPQPAATQSEAPARPADATGAPAAVARPAATSMKAALASPSRVRVETPSVRGSINLVGAQFDDLVLPRYRETVDRKSPPVRLLTPAGTPNSYFASVGWVGEGVVTPGPDTVWGADSPLLTTGKPVTLRWDNATGQTFLIRVAIDERYMFTIEQSVVNNGGGAIGVRPYSFVNRVRGAHSGGSMLAPTKDVDSWTMHIGPVGTFSGRMNYDIDYDDLDSAGASGTRFQTSGGWLGFGETYWLAAIIPDRAAAVDAGFRAGKGSYQAEFSMPQTVVAPGKSIRTTSRLFAGAKEVRTLDDYETKLGITFFGKAIDWGWFEIIMKPIFYLLDWLFRMVNNFGVAIILLTFIVRGLMFPIAQRQFSSMAAMRAVQPKLKALQERYKDDKPKLQQEMMALYQKEKINPVAGCLPIFLQIPVFYALYKVLMLTIEMRHQPFVGWIKDLSAPDPLTPVNLFGLLDFTPPSIIALGVLPILLGITMWLQFKLNPAPLDPVQQQVFGIMPWIFMFLMAPFAAGLQLYWTVSNILTIAQQKWLYSRHPALKEPLISTKS
jgi:YidC/Oxa1 family membrane protein insertase